MAAHHSTDADNHTILWSKIADDLLAEGFEEAIGVDGATVVSLGSLWGSPIHHPV